MFVPTALGWILIGIPLSLSASAETDLALTSEPYRNSGLFANRVLPQEGEEVTLTVRAECRGGEVAQLIPARLTIAGSDGRQLEKQDLQLQRHETVATGTWTWQPPANGLYTVTAEVDPAKAVAETDEANNQAEILLPVLVKGRTLHFAWYRDDLSPRVRWATCITSTATDLQHLAERGIKPLAWAYGGMSWSYYDKQLLEADPERFWREFEEIFYKMYSGDLPAPIAGQGIDETGGFPGTFAERASATSMKALARAKQDHPERFFAVWHGGGVRQEVAQHVRQGADLFLLETYIWRALPNDLSTEDIYQTIQDRLDPFIRSADMIVPAYGNPCYTLIGLDTSERPDYTDLGEQEEVVRFIRRSCPEMRGLAFYNAGYGGYGLERTAATDRHHEAVLDNADRLCFEYFIQPCLTLMRESLWLNRVKEGWVLTAAVSNIGGMDSGPVTVEFRLDGRVVGQQRVSKVAAGPNRNLNRVLLKQRLLPKPGIHGFEARIVAAPEATVLDSVARCERLVR